MRQVVLTAPKQIEFREVAAPEAGNLKSDEVLLRILRIGICGSEIHSYHGQHPATFYPVVQGHEYSAEVVAVGGAVRKVKPGDRVTGRPQLVCGECNPCKRGQYNVCSNLRVEAFQADGVAQDYFVIPEERVVALPKGCRPTTARWSNRRPWQRTPPAARGRWKGATSSFRALGRSAIWWRSSPVRAVRRGWSSPT